MAAVLTALLILWTCTAFYSVEHTAEPKAKLPVVLAPVEATSHAPSANFSATGEGWSSAAPSSETPHVSRTRVPKYTAETEARLPSVRRPEPPVDTAAMFRCLADRLDVDVESHTQHPLSPNKTVPLLVVPLLMETRDFRALMCSIQTSIRYLLVVVNGGIPEVYDFVDDIEAEFNWTGRVKVLRYDGRRSYASSINTGIAEALRLPAEEVPFMFATNPDVRFTVDGVDALTQHIRVFHDAVAKDSAVITQLQAEVSKEPSRFTPKDRSLRGAWSPNAVLVTSALLPDRIRYMGRGERSKAFAKHSGLLSLNYPHRGFTFGLSRLAMLTVGYWDENYHPAYAEDLDYIWRLSSLGFGIKYITFGAKKPIHYADTINSLRMSAVSKTEFSPKAQQILKEFGVYVSVPPESYQYTFMKWDSPSLDYYVLPNNGLPFEKQADSTLPTDVWVRDPEYIRAIDARMRGEGGRGVYSTEWMRKVISSWFVGVRDP